MNDESQQAFVWSDPIDPRRDELRRNEEFIRAGGLEEARQKEVAELKERRRRAKAEQVAGAWETRSVLVAVNRDRSPGPRTSNFVP